jgi:hypothetical protein
MKKGAIFILKALLITSLIYHFFEFGKLEKKINEPIETFEEKEFEELVKIVDKYVDIIKIVGNSSEYDYETYIKDKDLQYNSNFDSVKYSQIEKLTKFKINIFFYKKFFGNKYLIITIDVNKNLKYRKVFKIKSNTYTVNNILGEMYSDIYNIFT